MQKSIHRPHHKIVCAELRAVREAAGLTQVELAGRFKNTQAWVSSVEVGITRLDTVQVWEWCQACGTTLSAFVAATEKGFSTLAPERKRSRVTSVKRKSV
jgi:transcriptional regulator with XRE-family HTH domain